MKLFRPAGRTSRARHDAQQRPYYFLGENVALTRLIDGHFLFVDPQDRTISMHLVAHGFWEKWIHSVVCKLVRRGDRIIEVGANLGYYTVALSRRVGPGGQVIAIEANPRLTGLLERSVEFNGYRDRVTVLQVAATHETGPLHFTTSRANSGGGHLGLGWTSQDDEIDVEIQGVRLDDLDVDGPVRLIRIDAEGSEALILRGAERLLGQHDIIVCMEWDVVQMTSRTDVPEFIEWLVERGLKFWRIREDETLTPVPPQALATLEACDLIVSRNKPAGL